MFKQCTKCNGYLTIDSFYKSKNTGDGRQRYCKECNKQINDVWVRDNKDKIRAAQKRYREKHPERVKRAVRRAWRKKHPKPILKDPDPVGKRCTKCKEYKLIDEYFVNKNEKDKRTQKCKICVRQQLDEIRKRPESKKRLNEYMKNRNLDPKHRINARMSNAIYRSLRKKGSSKCNHGWEAIVGYTKEDLKLHIESLFTSDMSWEALLAGDIDIDHIRPIASFNYSSTDDAEFKECWSMLNLQPLWHEDNIQKGDKYTPTTKQTS